MHLNELTIPIDVTRVDPPTKRPAIDLLVFLGVMFAIVIFSK